MLKYILIFLTILATVFSHQCLIAPHQRGTMNNINNAATPDCGLTVGPCGGRTANEPGIEIRPAIPFTVTFQKNENHFNPDGPGNFTIDYSMTGDSGPWRILSVLPDTNTDPLTLYSQVVKLPIRAHDTTSVLRVTYWTNNPAAPPAFYQCADIVIY
jgi:hypothetical protein